VKKEASLDKMNSQDYILALFLAVLLVVIFYSWYREQVFAQKTERLSATDPSIIGTKTPPPVPPPPKAVADTRSFYELTDGEKITFIVDTYFKSKEEQAAEATAAGADTVAQDKYINNLPQSDQGCDDQFDDCSKWAANNECIINPEFMLYSCSKSCQACSLSEQDKYNLVQIYNSRSPPNCAYRKGSYPDRQRFLRELEKVHNDPGIPI
jgi:hypothetical protein